MHDFSKKQSTMFRTTSSPPLTSLARGTGYTRDTPPSLLRETHPIEPHKITNSHGRKRQRERHDTYLNVCLLRFLLLAGRRYAREFRQGYHLGNEAAGGRVGYRALRRHSYTSIAISDKSGSGIELIRRFYTRYSTGVDETLLLWSSIPSLLTREQRIFPKAEPMAIENIPCD